MIACDRTVRFVVNPSAGGSGVALRLAAARRALSAAGFASEVMHTAGPGDARELAGASGASAVVAVGGDGTIREVASGLAGTGVPMAVLPAGTENLFAKQFGFSARPDCLARTLERYEQHAIDIGMVDGEPFLVIAGIGFDAEIVERVTRLRAGHITKLDYFWPIWRTTWGHSWPQLNVRIDDEVLFDGRALVFVANMPRYAVNINPCPDARWDDGMLDVCVMPCRNFLQLSIHALRTVLRANRGAIRSQGRRLTISSPDDPPMQIDGDPASSLPASITVRPAALKILLPAAR